MKWIDKIAERLWQFEVESGIIEFVKPIEYNLSYTPIGKNESRCILNNKNTGEEVNSFTFYHSA